MKASELIKILEKENRETCDLDVFVEHYEYETSLRYTPAVGEYIKVNSLTGYTKEQIMEYWGANDNPDGPGLIWAVCIGDDKFIERDDKSNIKIKGRKAIPNYYSINYRIRKSLSKDYKASDYNIEYMKSLACAIDYCNDFECGNISDSSDILILSVEKDFDEYTLNGIFEIPRKEKLKRILNATNKSK